jgi:membrane protease subunit (stomatin/prohibitin family)
MSFWNKLTNTVKDHAEAQFLDVIEWLDDSRDTLLYRYPIFNQAIQDGGKLVVRPGQAAIFVSEGNLSEVFAPGTYELSTRTKSVMSFFESIKYQFNYPYKGDILYVNTRRFSDQKWGTAQPFLFEDPNYGGIEVRAFGIFEYRITDPALFVTEVVGTDGLFTTKEINKQLKGQLVAAFRSNLKRLAREKGITVNHLDSAFFELKQEFLDGMNPVFEEKYGISLSDFTIEGLNLPDDLRAILNKRREMDMMGDVNRYTQFQAANALRDAAQNTGTAGGMMGAGMGLGVGQVMGNMMGTVMQPGQGQPPQAPPPPPGGAMLHYNGPSGQGQYTAAQIADFVRANRSGNHSVWANGWPAWKPWNQVPEIQNLIPPEPPPIPGGGRTFHYNGPSGQQQGLNAPAVADLVKAAPDGKHLVWAEGMPGWTDPMELPEVKALMSSGPPPLPGGPPPLP